MNNTNQFLKSEGVSEQVCYRNAPHLKDDLLPWKRKASNNCKALQDNTPHFFTRKKQNNLYNVSSALLGFASVTFLGALMSVRDCWLVRGLVGLFVINS